MVQAASDKLAVPYTPKQSNRMPICTLQKDVAGVLSAR